MKINSHQRICDWGRIYLTEEPEAFAIKCRGRGSTRRLGKLPKEAEEDLLAEVQRLRTENEYLKNLQALILEDKRRQHKNAGSSGVKAKTLSRYSSLNGSRM